MVTGEPRGSGTPSGRRRRLTRSRAWPPLGLVSPCLGLRPVLRIGRHDAPCEPERPPRPGTPRDTAGSSSASVITSCWIVLPSLPVSTKPGLYRHACTRQVDLLLGDVRLHRRHPSRHTTASVLAARREFFCARSARRCLYATAPASCRPSAGGQPRRRPPRNRASTAPGAPPGSAPSRPSPSPVRRSHP